MTDIYGEYKRILSNATEIDRAALFESSLGQNEVQAVTIDLTTARLSTDPMQLGFPFRSFVVVSATDSNVSVNLKLSTQDTYQSAVPLKRGSALTLPYPVRKGFLHWDAQTGKSITILFLVTGEFKTNILDLVNSGGVTISDGTSFTTSVVSLTASTATQLFPSDTSRKTASWVNDTGADVWVGNSSVSNSGANKGFRVAAGATFNYRNTAALYAYSIGGSATEVIFQEF